MKQHDKAINNGNNNQQNALVGLWIQSLLSTGHGFKSRSGQPVYSHLYPL